MSTVSTKEIAAIPQAGEQETKGISSPLESAESDPVSVMAEPTSRSFMLLPAPGLRKWLYCSRDFSRGKADLIPILRATAPCADKAILHSYIHTSHIHTTYILDKAILHSARQAAERPCSHAQATSLV